MPSASYELEVVTPEGQGFHGLVNSAQLPGVDGSFGILARHAAMLAAVECGVLKLELDSGESKSFAIGEGFVEVSGGSTKVLTEFQDEAGAIDEERAHKSRERAKERLKHRGDSNLNVLRAEAALRRAIARLSALGKPSI
jgi:F-type H+-transporting ATPase subunit epsilon